VKYYQKNGYKMNISNCPGADKLKVLKIEIIKCKNCGYENEIWSDEIEIICEKCKQPLKKKFELNCIDWCKYSRYCVGETKVDKYMANKLKSIKNQLIEELEHYFGEDKKRINHAKEVLYYAEKILQEEAAEPFIVIPAAILHDVGIKIAEQKYGSASGHYQEIEGPPIAREMLLKTNLKKEDIDEICKIIGHHHSPGKINTINFKVLYDADWIVNIRDEVEIKDKEKLKKFIDKVFQTRTGKRIAEEKYLK